MRKQNIDGCWNNPSGKAFGEAYFRVLEKRVPNAKLDRYYREFLRGNNPHGIVVHVQAPKDNGGVS